jgi:hypothetical protein
LRESPIRRPHDFAPIEEELLRQYEAATGKAYPRPQSQASASIAATVLDMGQSEDAGEKPKKKRGRPKKNPDEKAALSEKKEEENLLQPAQEPFDPTRYNDPARMTQQRRAVIEDLGAEMDDDFERGNLSREGMLALVEESYGRPSLAFENHSLRALYGLYKPIELLAVDDEGQYHDFEEHKAYMVNGEPFCCWSPMDKTKGGFKCRLCGSSTKKPSDATAPKKTPAPKSENDS